MAHIRDLWNLPLGEARQAAGFIAKAALDGRPKQHATMVARHGRGPEGATCGDCYHLDRDDHQAGTYFKCALYGHSHGAGTDWRKKWPACGAYDADADERRRKADEAMEKARMSRAAIRHGQMEQAYREAMGRDYYFDLNGWQSRGRRRELLIDQARAFKATWYAEHPEEGV